MTDYPLLLSQARELLDAEPFYVAALSNLSALLAEGLADLNWAGFYLLSDGRLTVGPFQGKPACIHIPVGKGVCGTAVARDSTLIVPDVHRFEGHIACDGASNSEIVVPIRTGGRITAVLDLDSPLFGRFTQTDAAGLEAVAALIGERIRWEKD